MSTKLFRLMSAAMVLCAVEPFFTSCSSDDDKTPKIEVKDDAAGTFVIKNLSTHASIGQNPEVINRDTILIAFRPKQDYRESTFTIMCEGLEKICDSLYILPKEFFDDGVKIDGNVITVSKPKDTPNSIEVKASAIDTITTRTTDNEKSFIVKSETTFTLNVAKSYAIIPLQVGLSSDLKSLVDVKVSYTDINGIEQQFQVNDDEWINSDKANDTYVFTMNTRFLNIKDKEVMTTFTAHYSQKNDIVYDKKTYILAHDLSKGKGFVFIPGSSIINIGQSINWSLVIGGRSEYEYDSEDVATYLDDLSQNPDKKKYCISKQGEIKEVKE